MKTILILASLLTSGLLHASPDQEVFVQSRRVSTTEIGSHTSIMAEICCKDGIPTKNNVKKVFNILIKLNEGQFVKVYNKEIKDYQPYVCSESECNMVEMFKTGSLENPLRGLYVRFYCSEVNARADLQTPNGAYVPIVLGKGLPDLPAMSKEDTRALEPCSSAIAGGEGEMTNTQKSKGKKKPTKKVDAPAVSY